MKKIDFSYRYSGSLVWNCGFTIFINICQVLMQMGTRVVYIHRGRNRKSTEIGKLFTNADFNFDYRGKNIFLLILKALLTSTEIPKADIYFVEGGLCLNVAFFVKALRVRSSKIILMVPEPLFHLSNASFYKIWWIKKLMSKVDGVIAVSEMVGDDARKVYSGPIEIGHHYAIDLERYLDVKPNFNSRKIAFVVDRPNETSAVKGLDAAIKTFKIIKEKFPESELLLLGAGTEFLDFGIDGIKYLGFIDMLGVYKEISIIISPAKYDAFPVVIVEAACAGVVPFISSTVGSKEFVEKVDPFFVIPSQSPDEFARRIIAWWQRDKAEVKKKSEELRKVAQYYNKDNCMKEFKRAWKKLTGNRKC